MLRSDGIDARRAYLTGADKELIRRKNFEANRESIQIKRTSMPFNSGHTTQEFKNPVYSNEPSISDSSKYSVTSTTAKSRPIAGSQASTQGKTNYKTTVKTVTLNKIPLKLTVSA